LSRILLAFKSFFGILFGGELPAEVAQAFGYSKAVRPAEAPRPSAPVVNTSDGAIQMLTLLQRDARLVDFLMEDISGYGDDQVGAAVRSLHEQSRQVLRRYVTMSPVIDGVEGTYTKLDAGKKDPSVVKLIGNVPADGKVAGGTLRHKGWRADRVDLPVLNPKQDLSVIAPAEVEIE
jgi:hypothetical protein